MIRPGFEPGPPVQQIGAIPTELAGKTSPKFITAATVARKYLNRNLNFPAAFPFNRQSMLS